MDMLYPQGRILVFCKAPQPGMVKTRLQPRLSAEQCAQLHARLAQHTLQTAVASRVAAVELWCAGEIRHPFFQYCCERYGIEYRLQQGEDLGARMLDALATTLRSSAFAVIIGTDCPALEKSHLQTAALFLADDSPRIMLGPASDGGYVLLGSNRVVSRIFTDIDWGGPEVLKQTRLRLQTTDFMCSELEALHDIDRPEDLHHLPAALKAEFC
ncbi:MAG TPA: TIGR04282 family arsenosugar biosynthesis glycosyltransferase [Gammaproteobacteria bacterium]